ncbi:MAG TPA: hypothetical protein VLQ80_14610 [Candidatus Saccharimonadia bacterium]|nr:hypothetical protein [Candidatus Saccharimonadia bacterium]
MLDPDTGIDVDDRRNLSLLLRVMSEAQESCLHALLEDRAALHAALQQAQAARPAPEEVLP